MVTACLDFGLFNLFLLTTSGITLISDDARICGIEGADFSSVTRMHGSACSKFHFCSEPKFPGFVRNDV